MLEKYNLTTDMLAEYYKDHLRLSIYKSLIHSCIHVVHKHLFTHT